MEKSLQDHWEMRSLSPIIRPRPLPTVKSPNAFTACTLSLKRGGLERGGKVALLGRNSTSWAIVYLAVTTYGATVVPILPDFHPSDFENIIAHSDSRFLYASPGFFEKLDRTRHWVPRRRVLARGLMSPVREGRI